MAQNNDNDNNLRWVPLESNPELFSSWASTMGLDTSSFGYHDIYGLDDELLQMVPQPVQAVLLLFPITQQVEQMRIEEDEKVQQRAGAGEGGSLWFKQTIGNACGTIGLLHSIANSTARDAVSPSSPLATLLARAAPLDPLARAKLLSESRELETAHSVTASAGQTAAPAATDDVNLHFVCFVRDNNARLVELDGRRRGVLDRGECPTQDDLLKVATNFVQRKYMSLDDKVLNFNLIALAPAANDGA